MILYSNQLQQPNVSLVVFLKMVLSYLETEDGKVQDSIFQTKAIIIEWHSY